MRQDDFLSELETRLEENRRMAEQSWLPSPLHGLASYLGFHTFRSLVVASLAVTMVLFWQFYPELMKISREIFLFL
jgi:hypothetical protein